MNEWSARRKTFYLLAGLGILVLIITLVVVFILSQREPTCFDGKQNGTETGTDCGGRCQLLCSAEVAKPTLIWSRSFQVTPEIYSAVAYIENPNINSEGDAGYVFKIYDSENVLIATRENKIHIPKNRVLAIFEPNINTGSKTPTRTVFEFKGDPVWYRSEKTSPTISVAQKILSGTTTSPRIDADVINNSPLPIKRTEVVAIVYDNNQNAIGASRTFIDNLAASELSHVTFTWPQPFPTSEEVCRVPTEGGSRPESLGVVLALDRSGSMASLGKNPPQPLTDVKEAVSSFVRNLTGTDQVGVVSFAGNASAPAEFTLSSDYDSAISAIMGVSIQTGSTQYTNIAEAIEKSQEQFSSPVGGVPTHKVIVLLTDGVANRPEKAGDKNYPETVAKNKAELAKEAGTEIFTIGLGSAVNKDFLSEIASTPEHYFSAASAKDLVGVYERIAVSFCSVGPAVVEIIPSVVSN